MMVHLLVKVHEEDNFVLNGREEVVFVDKLVDIFVSQPQVDLQSSVIALVICVSKYRQSELLLRKFYSGTVNSAPEPESAQWRPFRARGKQLVGLCVCLAPTHYPSAV